MLLFHFLYAAISVTNAIREPSTVLSNQILSRKTVVTAYRQEPKLIGIPFSHKNGEQMSFTTANLLCLCVNAFQLQKAVYFWKACRVTCN